MRKSVARRHLATRHLATRQLAISALLLLALAATLAFGDAVRASNGTTGHAAPAAAARSGTDAHAIAAIPARAAEWANSQHRGPQGNDQLVAVLLAVSVLALAQGWRRAAFAPSRSRAGLGGHRAPSRAPPAFA